MKKLLLLLFILFSSSSGMDSIREFHVSIVGEEQVRLFEMRFPQIANNEAVYIAYLQRYYTGHERDFTNLIK